MLCLNSLVLKFLVPVFSVKWKASFGVLFGFGIALPVSISTSEISTRPSFRPDTRSSITISSLRTRRFFFFNAWFTHPVKVCLLVIEITNKLFVESLASLIHQISSLHVFLFLMLRCLLFAGCQLSA